MHWLAKLPVFREIRSDTLARTERAIARRVQTDTLLEFYRVHQIDVPLYAVCLGLEPVDNQVNRTRVVCLEPRAIVLPHTVNIRVRQVLCSHVRLTCIRSGSLETVPASDDRGSGSIASMATETAWDLLAGPPTYLCDVSTERVVALSSILEEANQKLDVVDDSQQEVRTANVCMVLREPSAARGRTPRRKLQCRMNRDMPQIHARVHQHLSISDVASIVCSYVGPI
jgi:hypothetical protein